jgi:ferredoxin--NADP+ reductase
MYTEKVTSVKHYSDRLFSFTTTRSNTFRFRNGEFAMIGLDLEPVPIFRAYSIVSTCYDDYLEFLSIKVTGGPLTTHLQNITVGDSIMIRPKTVGSLVIDYVKPAKNLVLLSTGTGIAPFMSVAHDFETYNKFENVYLFHTVRNVNELAYLDRLREIENENFRYIESVTREPYRRPGRFWDHIEQHLPGGLDQERDSLMVCGSVALNEHVQQLLKSQGWREGNVGGVDADFMVERAFVG